MNKNCFHASSSHSSNNFIDSELKAKLYENLSRMNDNSLDGFSHSSNDLIDSDLEAELYGQLHHEPNTEFPTLNEEPPSFLNNHRQVEIKTKHYGNLRHQGSEIKTYSRKRFFDPELTLYKPAKRQRREVQDEGKKKSCKKKERVVQPTLAPVPPPVIIDISDSPLRSFLVDGKRSFAAHRLGKESDNTPSSSLKFSHKRKHLNKDEVITVIDSDEIVDVALSTESDSTVVLSDSDNDVIVDEGKSTDIRINVKDQQLFSGNLGFTDVDVDKMLLQMPGDPSLWPIDEKDRYPTQFRQTFRYQEQARLERITCLNCKERGHLARNCTKPKRLAICYLCGANGHEASLCPRPACDKCMSLGHRVEQCRWPNKKNAKRECPSCNMKGHLREDCPDNWRKYHLTKTVGAIVKSSKPSGICKKSCFNCGAFGHFGHACTKKRMNTYCCPCLPWVVNYDKPSAAVGKKHEQSEQSKKDRNRFFTKIYNKKQMLVENANSNFLKHFASKVSGYTGRKVPGKRKPRFDKRVTKLMLRQLHGSFGRTYVQNGQLHYPREVGVQSANWESKSVRQNELQHYQKNIRNYLKPRSVKTASTSQ